MGDTARGAETTCKEKLNRPLTADTPSLCHAVSMLGHPVRRAAAGRYSLKREEESGQHDFLGELAVGGPVVVRAALAQGMFLRDVAALLSGSRCGAWEASVLRKVGISTLVSAFMGQSRNRMAPAFNVN